MLYGVLPRPDARLLPQVLSPHPAPHPGPRTRPRASAPAPGSHSGSLAPVLASGPRTPVSALLPPHPGPHSGPVFRAVHSGLALRPRPAPTFCPALWVADLKGGFWKEAFAFRAQAPVPAFWPCVPALCSGPHNPVLAPRLLAFRPASASHFDPRTPARTPVLHSGPVFREGRLLRFEPALRSSRTDPRTPPSHPALAPGLALRPTHPGPHSGPVFRAVHSGLALRPRPAPTFCPALWVADLKGGFWKEAFAFRAQAPVPAFWPCVPALTTRSSRPGSSHSALRRPRTSTLHPGPRTPPPPCTSVLHSASCTPPPALRLLHSGLAPRLLHSRPAFRAAVLKEGFRATFWNVAFRAAVLKEGGYAAVPV